MLRFGNIHVVSPLVYERFLELKKRHPNNLYADDVGEPNNKAMHFLADATGEEVVEYGFDRTGSHWKCFEFTDGRALLLTNLNGNHLQSFRDFQKQKRETDKNLTDKEIVLAYLNQLIATDQKIHWVRADQTRNMTDTHVPGYIVADKDFFIPLRRFKALGFPGSVAEPMARQQYERQVVLDGYMPRISRAFQLGNARDKQADFIDSLLSSVQTIFKGNFQKLQQKKFKGSLWLHVIRHLESDGYKATALDDYANDGASNDNRNNRRWILGHDLLGLAESLLELEQPSAPQDKPPENRLRDYF